MVSNVLITENNASIVFPQEPPNLSGLTVTQNILIQMSVQSFLDPVTLFQVKENPKKASE